MFYFKNLFSTALCLALSDGLSSTYVISYDLPVVRRFTLDVPNQPGEPPYLESIQTISVSIFSGEVEMASSLGGDLHNATTMETDRGKLCRYRVSQSSSNSKKRRKKLMKENYD